MKRSPKLRPTLWDGLVLLLTLAMAVGSAWFVWGGEDAGELTVVISMDGEEVERCPLTEFPKGDGVYTCNGYTLKVGVNDSDEPRICVAESDCPTQDCVHTGEIGRAGQSIVCLPARIIIQLEGGTASGDGPDIVID